MHSKNIRVIAGAERGRKIWGPGDRSIRPATGMIKEYMFNIIQNTVHDADVLDLFAGTGSLGIEALSRGARHVTFVDSSPAAVELIHKNLGLLKNTEGEYTVVKNDAIKYVNDSAQKSASFDIIFADPPFPYDGTAELVNLIDRLNILAENGLFIVRYNRDIRSELNTKTLKALKYREFGDSRLSVFAHFTGQL
jgi:16S rRNA (guanine(966)-N(2))-methyltransferase RsmD